MSKQKRSRTPLTDEQKAFIKENYGKMSVAEIHRQIGATKYRIREFTHGKSQNNAQIKSGFFNVNERENWIV